METYLDSCYWEEDTYHYVVNQAFGDTSKGNSSREYSKARSKSYRWEKFRQSSSYKGYFKKRDYSQHRLNINTRNWNAESKTNINKNVK